MTLRVLLADDQALLRGAFRLLLESTEDITVVGEAGDGREAVRLTRQFRPHGRLMPPRDPAADGETTAADEGRTA
ncbi:response regulator transcription factor [Streptomyces sp. I4(2020)]|uniref:response regulator transcription factor n=1 Tax=Streptomyces sp. I4(2020) TaxID=2760981 RepID=UPI0035A991DC|nr:hypothetical protein [Streptomyces sp. I3(2020)]MBJ6625487.1 hypothetical protein [Streptomyces sp. I4(2020)]